MRRHVYMTSRRFAIGLVCAFVATAGPVFAQSETNGVPGDWLSRYMSARTAGFGGAFVAAANDPVGAVWNPAGLSYMAQNQVHVESARLFESTTINGLSFAMPGRRLPSFGMTILNLSSGDFEKTSDLNQSLGEFKEGDFAFLFSLSKQFSTRFALGANVKVVRQSVDEFDAAGVGFDLGAIYRLTPVLRVGVSALNIGGPTLTLRSVDETFPTEFRGGAALEIFGGRGLLSADINHRDGPGTAFHAGSEFWIHHTLALRVGYAEDSPTGGFSYAISPNAQFDYAATDHELGITHRFGLSYRFGGFFASSQAVPAVFSPIGQQSVTKIHLKARTKADASSWSLEIVDKSGIIVRQFSGKGSPPAHVMWDGKDEAGLPLPDGTYKYRLRVEDTEGRVFEGHEHSVEITTQGPQGAVPVYTD